MWKFCCVFIHHMLSSIIARIYVGFGAEYICLMLFPLSELSFVFLYLSLILQFSGVFLHQCTVGWGSFHLGFSGNTDPEPGRCRRTDGKKWRCSRDAVADQKYCERHINRGRHRSRKPVEGQAGHSHSVAGASNITTAATATKLISSSASTAAVSCNGSPNNLSFANQHFKNLHRAGSHPPPSSAAAQINR